MSCRRDGRVCLFVAVFLLLLLATAAIPTQASNPGGQAQGTKEIKAEVIYPCTVQLSPPFKTLPISTEKVAIGHEREINNPRIPKSSSSQPNFSSQTDPVVQYSPGIDAMPGTLAAFAGITNIAGVAPPDTQGDIGPDYYVQWVNLHLAAWQINRSTTPYTATNVLGPIAGNTIWSSLGGPCATNNNGDPIVLWDRFRNRWVISQFALPSPYYTAIAVSQTADPTGSWWLYCFQYDTTNMNDYPKFGIWPDGYYMTVNQFANASTWAGAGLCVFEADKMISGDASARMLKFNLGAVNSNYGGMQPAHFEGMTNPPAGSPCYFLEVDDGTWIPGYSNDALRLWKASVNWTTATFTVGLAGEPDLILDTASWDVLCSSTRDCIPQPGTTQHVDAIGDRLMYRLQYRNYGSYESMVVNHTVDAGSGRAGIRWYELRKDASHTDWYIYQQGTFAPSDTYNRWMGSAAQDHMGDLAIGYSVSDGTSMYPSIFYAGRLASDPAGELTQGEAQMYLGAAAQTGVNRWGDYSSMSIDPYDDCAFWYTQEYSTGGWNWATRVGAFKYGSCTIGPTGTLSGTVTDTGATPISGATVLANNGTINVSTNTAADGSYSLTLPTTPPTFTVTASKYAYLPSTATGVAISENATTTQNFTLGAAPSHTVSGSVSDASTGWPLYAKIVITGSGYPGSTIWTDPAAGTYGVTLVDGITYTLTVTAWLAGYNGASSDVTPSGANITKNFFLTANAAACTAPGYTQSISTLFSENFDSVTAPAIPAGWAVLDVSGTAGNWATATTTQHPSGQPPHSAPNLVFFNSYSASSGNSTRLYRTNGLNLTGYSGLMVSFWMYHDTGYSSNADNVQVQVSTDGGTTWQNVGAAVNRYDGTTGWKQHTVALSGFTGSLSDVRIGLLGTSAYGNDVHIDDFAVINSACTLPTGGGLIVGNVYDANTGGPATGSLVSNATTGGSATTVATSDPNVDDSFYCMYGLDGTNSLTASKTGYGSDSHGPVVPHYGAVLQNFNLAAGRLQASLASMSAEMLPGQTTTQTLTITNTGGAPANFTLQELNMALSASPSKSGSVKASMMTMRKQAAKLEKAKAETSIGRAPSVPKFLKAIEPADSIAPLPLNPGPPAYACDIYPGSNLVYFPDVGIPGTWTDLGSYGSGYSFFGGDFLNGDFTKLYAIDYTGNQLCTIDTATHAVTVIGPSTPLSGESWTGLTASNDGTLYASSTNVTRSTLYTMNPATGAATQVGQITNGAGIIDIAINSAGQMYGVEIVSDSLISIDTATGAGTVVGALGAAANYAQGLGFDDLTNTLYWAAYTTQGELRTIDTTTGASTLIGALPGGDEVDALGIATFVSPDVPWLSEAPVTQTLAPGAHVDIAVTYDSTGLSAGTYHAQLKFANDTPYTVANVPVTLTVLPSLAVATSANALTGPAPLLTSFTSNVLYGTSPYTYDWNFGDGTPHSDAANPSHRFTAPGTYPVTLQVHDSGSPSHVPPLPVQNASDTHLSVVVTAGLVDRIPYSVTPTKITTTNHGTDATVTWDATNCPSANYHIIYGMGSGLAAWSVSGGKCAIGYSGTYSWSALPNPSADSSHFLWFLVTGDDSATTEGSWGKTSAGTERGGAAASNQCGCTTKVTATTCGTTPNVAQ